MQRSTFGFICTLPGFTAAAAGVLLWAPTNAQQVSATASGRSSDTAAIHQWVDHWYGEQKPDKDGYVMRMTVDYLRITGNRAIVAGDYGHALPGASKLNSLSGHYVRLLEKKAEKWVNTDKIGFVYRDFQHPSSAIKLGEP